MCNRALAFALCIAFSVLGTGCSQNSPDTDDLVQDSIDDSVSTAIGDDETIAALRAEIADLDGKLEAAESTATEAKSRADEAYELADDAKSEANNACRPYGYQPGCGNN